MVTLADFDRYCEEHDVQPGQYGEAFARWLANLAGRPISGELVDGPDIRSDGEKRGRLPEPAWKPKRPHEQDRPGDDVATF